MEKILKKYTTIPIRLYVNRDADIQLKRIIEDMQRPGYVLVARQMGKTNLLFNAKRILESEHRLFVYVDLSNIYENERDCYNNIINNIIEPNINLFESIYPEIKQIRADNLAPHNEYSRCLRIILKHFTGDIVIVLDEIDALKSVDYSDNIFAQIRSNYFSRTNFPEFERLTYVLSGVIEPTELIKDRNKSPFNIGDKIYLDDFTKDEHNEFIKKSELKITDEISDKIFDWANGNPRLTFDICSELENYVLDGAEVNKDLIDEIVKKKYLTTFDVAPIDHIRELVKSNKKIRQAIIKIYKNKSYELSDDIKRRLYLYGIINSKFDEETRIKNKVIYRSLSEDWIKSIDRENDVTLVNGFFKYDRGEYEDAIEIFLEILATSHSSKEEAETLNYFLGLSYYSLRNFDVAIEYFSKAFTLNETYAADAKLYLGLCKIGIGSIDEGLSILEESTQKETYTYAYYSALYNLGLNQEEKERKASIFTKLYEDSFKAKEVDEDTLEEFRTLALFHQAEILLRNSKIPEALDKVNEALNHANASLSLTLIITKYYLEDNKNESLKTQLVNQIIDNELNFDKQSTSTISFNEQALYLYLDFVFNDSDLDLFEKLLDYSTTKLLRNIEIYEIIYQAFLISSTNKLGLLKYIIKFEDRIRKDLLIDVYWNLTYHQHNNYKEYFEAFNKYLSLFISSNRITSDDIYLFALSLRKKADKRQFIDSIKLCKIIESKLTNVNDDDLKFESSVIYYWFAFCYFNIKDRVNAKRYADIALDLIQSSNKKAMSIIDEKGLLGISEHLLQIKNSSTIRPPTVNIKKYGRNERVKVRYLDGKVIEKKYKQLEADILSERCEIIQ